MRSKYSANFVFKTIFYIHTYSKFKWFYIKMVVNCFFMGSKKLSLTFTLRCNQRFSIFIMLELVFLNGFAVVGSKGGYFVNLLQFPSLCPLTSFCAAWNPTGPHKNITLIDHGKIQLAVDGIHILRCSIWILNGNLEFGYPKISEIAIYEKKNASS